VQILNEHLKIHLQRRSWISTCRLTAFHLDVAWGDSYPYTINQQISNHHALSLSHHLNNWLHGSALWIYYTIRPWTIDKLQIWILVQAHCLPLQTLSPQSTKTRKFAIQRGIFELQNSKLKFLLHSIYYRCPDKKLGLKATNPTQPKNNQP
jgi:hypothetical protein